MVIEICSQRTAIQQIAKVQTGTSVISITSLGDKDVEFGSDTAIKSLLHLKFNDLQEMYDEEGIPYGRPLPRLEDFNGLKDFVEGLQCNRLIIHCWEGTSRSAAVAAAIYEFRKRTDTLRTHQKFSPNPLVYALACRALGISQGNLSYEVITEDDGN